MSKIRKEMAVFLMMAGLLSVAYAVDAPKTEAAEKPAAETPEKSLDERLLAQLDARVEKIKQESGVNVYYKYSVEQFMPPGWRENAAAEQIPLNRMPVTMAEVEKFIKRVPRSVLEKNLDSIYLVKYLRFGKDHYVGAVATPNHGIYLCSGPAEHISNSIFHEFSHRLELKHPLKLEDWKDALPEGFTYVGGGSPSAGPDAFLVNEKLRSEGFIIGYCTTSISEDVAVLSDYVFTRPKVTKELMTNYPAIKRKVEFLVHRYQSISPDYDFSEYDDVLKLQAAPPPSP